MSKWELELEKRIQGMYKWELDLEKIFQDLWKYENEYQILIVTKGPFDPQVRFYRGAIEALFGILAEAGVLDQYIKWREEGSDEKSDNV